MTTRIWINRAGPSRIHAMDMLHSSGRELTIHATRTNPSAPSLKFADVSGWEPGGETDDATYAEFCLNYIRDHRIDVVIPTSRMTALAMIKDQAADLGCTILTVSEDVARITESKSATYEAASSQGIPTPPWRKVNSWDTFAAAVQDLRADGHRVCVKPDTGWAAGGFRILEDNAHDLSSLMSSPRPVTSAESYERALWTAQRHGETIPDLIVLPFLDEPEISVDSLSTPDGQVLTSIARAKKGWYREFSDDQRLHKMARLAVESFPLAYLSNVQMRYLDGEPVLLEINPRASAGLYHTRHTGVNMYWEAVKLALFGPGEVPQPATGKVAIIENALAA